MGSGMYADIIFVGDKLFFTNRLFKYFRSFINEGNASFHENNIFISKYITS